MWFSSASVEEITEFFKMVIFQSTEIREFLKIILSWPAVVFWLGLILRKPVIKLINDIKLIELKNVGTFVREYDIPKKEILGGEYLVNNLRNFVMLEVKSKLFDIGSKINDKKL